MRSLFAKTLFLIGNISLAICAFYINMPQKVGGFMAGKASNFEILTNAFLWIAFLLIAILAAIYFDRSNRLFFTTVGIVAGLLGFALVGWNYAVSPNHLLNDTAYLDVDAVLHIAALAATSIPLIIAGYVFRCRLTKT